MEKSRYITLGPLAGEGSRAFLGLRIAIPHVHPIVLIRVPEHVYSDQSLLTQLRLETQQASLLEHPNIVRVFGLAEIEEGLSRVVEFVNGESLRKIFYASKRQQMPPGLAARIVTDAARGVHYAHLAGTDDGSPLLHGELRPEALFVSYAGITKVSGYGASCLASQETTDQAARRRPYYAPEQIFGGSKAATEQTDVYQLGITLYEAITGNMPALQSGLPVEDAVVNSDLSLLNSEAIPQKLRQIIFKATAKKGSDRFPNPVAFGDALEEAMNPLPSTDALAFFLEGLFSGDSLRTTRMGVIEKGLADFASDLPRPDSLVTPTAYRVAKPQVNAPPEQPSVRLDLATATSSERPVPFPPTKQPGSLRGWLYFSIAANAVMTIASLVLFFAWRQEVSRRSPAKANLALTAPSVSSSTTPDSPINTPLSSSDAPDDSVDEPSPDEPQLVLSVVPAVDIWIDGKKAGVAPLTANLEPGPHVITLLNSKLGIRAKRTITVRPYGKTFSKITFGKGSVLVNAPPGATVFIDGKRAGEAPLSKEISVYEGNHRILVRFQGMQWKEDFALGNKERIRFDVELNPEN
jgi:serine/threonine-protein kinase